MKNTVKKLIAFMLCLTMIVGVAPYTVFASDDYENGQDCPGCGHYHWGDYMCDNCGYCSYQCTSDSCWMNSHCNNCGTCLSDDPNSCEDCDQCFECMLESNHCAECYACYVGNGDGLCGNCYRCSDCVGEICEDCGFCEDCANDEDGLHCPECGNCYQTTEQCENLLNNHCIECCNRCEQCGSCMFGAEDDICPDCELCLECCKSNAENLGGTGDVCVESSEWDDHICSDCGEYFELDDLCDSCGSAGIVRCPDCCENASECSVGMCEYTQEYEDHFCEDCGRCFDDVSQCDSCSEEKVMRCEECCADSTKIEYGCDDGLCRFSDGFLEHIKNEHPEHSTQHSATPGNRWSMDEKYHYRACRYCSDAAHITSKSAHNYDRNGVCTVCSYKNGSVICITKQPNETKAKVSDPFAKSEDRYYPANNVVKFSVRAQAQCELKYYWHVMVEQSNGTKIDYSAYDWGYLKEEKDKGARIEGYFSNTLTITVPYYACHRNYYVYCVVSDKNNKNKVASEKVKINADHIYSTAVKKLAESNPKRDFSDNFGGKTLTYRHSNGHRYVCSGCWFDDIDMDDVAVRSDKPTPHNFGTPYYKTSDRGQKYRVSKCGECGFEQYTAVHEHKYYDGKSCSIDYDATEKIGSTGHVLKCLLSGCTQTITESHDWGWKIVGWPSESQNGAMRRECKICGYSQDNVYEFDENGELKSVDWDMNTVLIEAKNATASKTIAKKGDKLSLTIKHFGSETPQRCARWNVYYQPDNDTSTLWDITDLYYYKVTVGSSQIRVQLIKNSDNTSKWEVKEIRLPRGNTGGGKLIFEPVMQECTKHSPIVINQKDPVCSIDGYTGDTVCELCGTVITKGNDIPATGQHRMSEEPIEGTARQGTCTRRSYSGNYLCLDCGCTLRGKSGDYYHKNVITSGTIYPKCREGYTGDYICVDCGKLAKKGKVIPECHNKITDSSTVIPSTCTAAGYSGDYICKDCGKFLERGKLTPRLNHLWVEDKTASSDKTRVYKCSRKGCSAMRFGDINGGSLRVNVTSFANLEDAVTLELLIRGESEPTYSATVKSDRTYENRYLLTYDFTDIPDGQYILRIIKDKHAVREWLFSIKGKEQRIDSNIYLYGDVNASGTVDSTDAIEVLKYNANVESIFDKLIGIHLEYRLKVANVTAISKSDEIVDTSDAIEILRRNAKLI